MDAEEGYKAYSGDYPERAAREVRKSGLPLAEQDKTIAELGDLVNMLVDRLQPVLTPVEPTDKDPGDRAVPVQSEVAETLSNHNSRLRRIISRVNNTIERLEV